jgi:hypothetical protein
MQIIGGKINPVNTICSYIPTFLSQTQSISQLELFIERSLSRWRIGSKQGLQKLPWVDALSSGGLHQTGKVSGHPWLLSRHKSYR